MMHQWMNAQRRLELWQRLCQLSDELQAIAQFWWELDPDMQGPTADDVEPHRPDIKPRP